MIIIPHEQLRIQSRTAFVGDACLLSSNENPTELQAILKHPPPMELNETNSQAENRTKIIKQDAKRTRSSILVNEEQELLADSLTIFLNKRKITYKQGLNQLMAPFMCFSRLGVSMAEWLGIFASFFDQFTLGVYTEDDLFNLDAVIRVLTMLIRYHQPSLIRYLEEMGVEPSLFCISWLMTLFSNKLSLQLTYELWIYICAEDDPLFVIFLVLGLIILRKDVVIESHENKILDSISNMIFKNFKELKDAIKIALLLRKNTPLTFFDFLHNQGLFVSRQHQQNKKLLERLNAFSIMLILPQQLLSKSHDCCNLKNCHKCRLNAPIFIPSDVHFSNHLELLFAQANDIRSAAYSPSFVLIDLRLSRAIIKHWPINRTFAVDCSLSIQEIEENFMRLFFEDKQNLHFVFLLNEYRNDDKTASNVQQFKIYEDFVELLLSYSFPLLSVLQGGYMELARAQKEKGSDAKLKGQSLFRNKATDIASDTPAPFMSLSSIVDLHWRMISQDNQLFVAADEILLFGKETILAFQRQREFDGLINFLQHSHNIMEYLFKVDNVRPQAKLKRLIAFRDISKVTINPSQPTEMIINCVRNRPVQGNSLRALFQEDQVCLEGDSPGEGKFTSKFVDGETLCECAHVLAQKCGKSLQRVGGKG